MVLFVLKNGFVAQRNPISPKFGPKNCYRKNYFFKNWQKSAIFDIFWKFSKLMHFIAWISRALNSTTKNTYIGHMFVYFVKFRKIRFFQPTHFWAHFDIFFSKILFHLANNDEKPTYIGKTRRRIRFWCQNRCRSAFTLRNHRSKIMQIDHAEKNFFFSGTISHRSLVRRSVGNLRPRNPFPAIKRAENSTQVPKHHCFLFREHCFFFREKFPKKKTANFLFFREMYGYFWIFLISIDAKSHSASNAPSIIKIRPIWG